MNQIFKCESSNFKSITNGICIEEKHLSQSQILHWHDFYEIEYFLDGSGVYIINGERYEIQPGMLFFSTPSDLQQIYFERNVHLINISFTTTFLTPILQNKLTKPIRLTDKEYFYSSILKEMLHNCNMVSKFSLQYLQSLLNVVLFRMYDAAGQPKRELPAANLYIMEAVTYMNEHFEEELSLELLADKLNLSQEYFSSLFHKTMHMTFSQYLISLRLKHAKTLLLLTQKPIREIQVSTGFHSASHFARSFRQKYHCSPSDFRNNAYEVLENDT